MSTPLNTIAPYPQTETDVTAHSLARHLTVQAWAQRTHRQNATDPTDREWATSEIVTLFAVVKLLRALQAVAPETADEAARDVWSSWEDGGSVDEWLNVWLRDFGIAPAVVDEAASELIRDAA